MIFLIRFLWFSTQHYVYFSTRQNNFLGSRSTWNFAKNQEIGEKMLFLDSFSKIMNITGTQYITKSEVFRRSTQTHANVSFKFNLMMKIMQFYFLAHKLRNLWFGKIWTTVNRRLKWKGTIVFPNNPGHVCASRFHPTLWSPELAVFGDWSVEKKAAVDNALDEENDMAFLRETEASIPPGYRNQEDKHLNEPPFLLHWLPTCLFFIYKANHLPSPASFLLITWTVPQHPRFFLNRIHFTRFTYYPHEVCCCRQISSGVLSLHYNSSNFESYEK